MKLLDGQRALITGAGSGIGKVMAQHFEKAGARIWICDADTNNLEQSLKENPDWNYEKLFSKTGISNRHLLDDNETPEDLSYKAAKACIENYKNKEIDGVLYVSQSPTNPLPTRACLLQDKLGITKNSLAFDINQGCSGFVYSLSLATSLIKNDLAERILIICSDHYSKYISKNDRTCRPIFSDAAAATIIEKSSDKKKKLERRVSTLLGSEFIDNSIFSRCIYIYLFN